MSVTISGSDNLVLQVVQLSTTLSSSTTSSSWVNTGVSASITPKFATSKILVSVSGQLYETTASQQGFMTIYRNSTELSGRPNGMSPSVYSQANAIVIGASMNYLDSPSTTSSTTYTIYIKATGGTLYWNGAESLCTIILMEIAG